MRNIFDENDIKALFSQEKPLQPAEIEVELAQPPAPAEKTYKPSKFNLAIGIKFVSLFILIFLFSYSIINLQALEAKFRYFFDVSIKRQSYSAAIPTPTPNFNPSSEARIVIPKIGVDAPIIWNVEESNLNEKLLSGVVHSQGTALPGDKGKVFITGHSSYYSWASSDYKNVFALLDKLAPGDKIYLKYSSSLFTYQVSGSRVVPPSEISVMSQDPGYNLALMTCVPVGTNINRLIVIASQIF